MSLSDAEYRPLERESKRTNLDHNHLSYQPAPTTKWTIKTLVLIAVVSSFCNILLVVHVLRNSSSISPKSHDKTLYAGLERDIPTPFRDDTLFSPRNRSLSDAAWDNWVVNPGIVALPHDWVKAKALPQAQQWPWDGDKGICLLKGYHNLHCLVSFNRQSSFHSMI